MRELEQCFKALADSTRLRILNLLLQGELCVCDVQMRRFCRSFINIFCRKAGTLMGGIFIVWVLRGVCKQDRSRCRTPYPDRASGTKGAPSI